MLTTLVFASHVWRYHGYLIDDAYISLRYARNLVEGLGLVFNATERVEGYTNFLWMLLGAGSLKLGLDGTLVWQLASFGSTLLILGVVGKLAGSDTAARASVPAACWLLGLEAFGYWSTTTMESMFAAALFTLAILMVLEESEQQRRRGSWVCFALLALTRPEGPLVLALGHAAAWLWLELPERDLRWRALPRHLVDAAIVGAVVGIHLLWRLSYYGAPLPNTYYAKVTGGVEQWNNGLISLGQWAASQPVLAATLLAPFLLLQRWRHHRRLMALVTVSLGWMAYVVSVGSDFMPFFRFFLPVLPLLAATASGLLAALIKSPTRQVMAASLLLAAQAVSGWLDEQSLRAFVAHRTTVVGLEVGHHLYERLPPDAWIAVNTAGAVPYASKRPTIDMLGLTDAAIARHPVYVVSPLWAGHRRGWGAYVRSRQPQVVIWYNAAGLAEPHYLGDHQLADDPFFRFFYQKHRTTLGVDDPPRLLGRFLGAPFGRPQASHDAIVSPDLGVRYELSSRPIEHTVARASNIELVTFELRDDAEQLWRLSPGLSDPDTTVDLGRFLDAARSFWRRSLEPGDPEARAYVEALCERARQAVARSDLATAQRLLSQAADANSAARSPLVYQYIANVASLEGDLFLAVQAQREALRLAPDNALYLRNLRSLLTVPYREFGKPQQGATTP
ncbi:MAG: hypothetical protein AAF560_23350 [Acidobacteriota bacterium]